MIRVGTMVQRMATPANRIRSTPHRSGWPWPKPALVAVLALELIGVGACSGEQAQAGASDRPVAVTQAALAARAYVVSHDSDELTVIDLVERTVIGRVATGGVENHMAELNADFSKVYVTSAHSNELIVIDARALEVIKRVPLGAHPSHLSASRDGALLAVVNEQEGAVSFLDTTRDVEVKRLPGFSIPHFVRWAPDARYAYVANLGANHITRVDTRSLEIDGLVSLSDAAQNPAAEQTEEFGFADAQIDAHGIMYAAHRGSGRVIVYDTHARQKLEEVAVGRNPWIAFAEHPFAQLETNYLVPNFGDRTVSLIDGALRRVVAAVPGDEEAYGVNFSSLTPERAFVMNRIGQDISVVDTRTALIENRIAVGGNTETASTTPDGRFVVATVSSADRVVFIDVATQRIAESFESIGRYPWSVTIPGGQNYCH